LPQQDVARAEAALATLGFSRTKVETVYPDYEQDTDKYKFHLDSGKLGVVAHDGNVNVLRGNRSVGSGTYVDKPGALYYAPDAGALVMHSGRPAPEGCVAKSSTSLLTWIRVAN